MSQRRGSVAALGALIMLATACGGSEQAGGSSSSEPIKVGVPLSLSGPFGIYGKLTRDGLEAGLACATNGTKAVNGRPVEFVYEDDGGDPAKALTSATGMVGSGINIIAGTVSTAAAIQVGAFAEQNDVLYITGTAGGDAPTGLNKHTFRASRQSYQESAALASLLDTSNATVAALAQDYTFGQGYVKTLTEIFGKTGTKVEPVLVPLDAKEFTPFAQKIVQASPDLLVVIYYGQTTGGMWQSLKQQGVLQKSKVATLLVESTNWSVYGDAAKDIVYVAQYVPGAAIPGGSAMNDCLLKAVPAAEPSTNDGFVTAQMVVRALAEAGPDDVPKMISALEGWSFEAPKGKMTIRASDHAMLQDMYRATLTPGADGKIQAKITEVIAADKVAPPEKAG